VKNKKYHTVGTIPNFDRRIVEKIKFDNLNTQIHDRSLSRLGTGTSIKSGGIKLILWNQTSPLSEVMQVSFTFD
jgi:hypothetical protein